MRKRKRLRKRNIESLRNSIIIDIYNIKINIIMLYGRFRRNAANYFLLFRTNYYNFQECYSQTERTMQNLIFVYFY